MTAADTSFPPVEIFIPTYNRARFLADAIDSALAQDYPNTRVIVIDNCSTDATPDVVARYQHRPNFTYLVNERNLGAIGNMNECGRRRSNDAYFTFFGSDDALLPNFASTMVRGFSAFPGTDVVAARFCIARGTVHNVVSRPAAEGVPALLSVRDLIEETPVSLAAFMVRPGFEFHMDDRYRYAPDQRMFREWALDDVRVCYLPVPVSIYCMHDGQATQREDTLLQYREVMEAHTWVAQQRPEFYAGTLMARLDHVAYIRSQREGRSKTVALLGALERLLRHRYFLAALHVRGLEVLLSSIVADINSVSAEVTAIRDALGTEHTPADHTTSLAFAEDGVDGPRPVHASAQRNPASLQTLMHLVSVIASVALLAEQLLPVADAVDYAAVR
jgi:glycosyl transferase family 2